VYVIYDRAEVVYVGMAGRDGGGSLRKRLRDHSSGQVVTLCRRHHTYVHEHGVRIVQGDSGDLQFAWKDGMPIQVHWTPPVLGPWSVEALRARNADDGIRIDAMTSFPNCDFRPPSYADAVSGLCDA
jgi:hypothetical protein